MTRHILLSALRRALCLAAALVLAAAARAETSESWPAISQPPHAKFQWVADRMKVNGIPMRVMRFESSVSRSEIVAFYAAHWTGGYETRPAVQVQGDTTVVGQMHGPYYMTLKVNERPDGASAGFISVSQLLGNAVVRDAGDFPLMQGARIVSVVESSDPGLQSRELVITQDAGAGVAGNYYRAALGNAGWRLVQETPDDAAHPRQAGSLEVYRRDASELSISVVPADGRAGSTVIATIVTKGTGSPAP